MEAEMPEQGKPGGWMVWAGTSAWVSAMTTAHALRQVTAPVLVIHGADDLQSEAATRLYVDSFPNAEFAVIENAGHFFVRGTAGEIRIHRENLSCNIC